MLRILAPHFCAGLVIGERAAPIISYMTGWSEAQVRQYCARKGWKVEAC